MKDTLKASFRRRAGLRCWFPVFAGLLFLASAVGVRGQEDKSAPLVFGRHVPERKDDFAWENDRVAFRMYGPALEADGEISSGIDVWSKSTSDLVIDKWYKGEDYHTDHGQGGDFYKVGPSRGCGGIAIYHAGKIVPSRNWTRQRILESKPDRLTFRLEYAPWEVGGREFAETKTISLKAGSNMNHIESVFSSDRDESFTVAVGIVLREGKGGVLKMDKETGLILYWEPETENGHIGCAVVVNPDRLVDMIEKDGHAIALLNAEIGKPVEYYAGACWSKSKYFPTVEQWEDYLSDFTKEAF